MTNHTLQRTVFQAAASLLGIGVILGALGAHFIADHTTPDQLNAYETGVRYLNLHALALLFLASFLRRIHQHVLIQVFWMFMIGVALFSGSIFILSTSHLWAGHTIRWVGPITPVGGMFMIAGWFWLALKGYKLPDGMSSENKEHRRRTHGGTAE